MTVFQQALLDGLAAGVGRLVARAIETEDGQTGVGLYFRLPDRSAFLLALLPETEEPGDALMAQWHIRGGNPSHDNPYHDPAVAARAAREAKP